VRLEDVRLYVEATEAAKEFVGRYFDKNLYFDYTHLVCRTALDGNTGSPLLPSVFLLLYMPLMLCNYKYHIVLLSICQLLQLFCCKPNSNTFMSRVGSGSL